MINSVNMDLNKEEELLFLGQYLIRKNVII